MTTNFVISKYRRYKAGQKKLVDWLWDSTRPFQAPPTSTREERLSARVKVTTTDLVTFAKQVVDATDPKIDIPIEILDITKDVISGRRLCAEWYASFRSKDGTSDEQHAYFISILEQVFDVMRKEHKARRPKRKKKMPDLPSEVNDLKNLYCHLGLEETSVEDTDVAPANETKPKQAPKELRQADEYELESPADERLFAIWSLLHDLLNIRTEIGLLWQRYRAGDISLLAASITTNNATDLMTCLTDDFTAEYPDLETYAAMIDAIGTDWYLEELRAAQAPSTSGAHLASSDGRSASTSATVLLCVDAWAALGDLPKLMSWHVQPKQDGFMNKSPTLICDVHPFTCRLYALVKDLLDVAPRLSAAMRADINCPYVDNATLLILRSATIVEPTAATVACTQVYMDIHDILNGDLGRGFDEAKAIVGSICKSLEQSHQCTAEAACHSRDHCPHTVRAVFCTTELTDGTTAWAHKPTPASGALVLPESIMQTLPLLPMWCAYKMLLAWQKYGASHCETNMSVLAAAHLYSAARLSSSLQGKWPDMEAFVAGQNKQEAFLRKGDGTLLALAKHYGMALGLTLTQVTRGSKASLPKQSQIILQHRKLNTLRAPESHTKPMISNKDAVRERHNSLISYYDFIRAFAKEEGIQDPSVAKQWKDTKRLSPQQLVSLLLESFIKYEPMLRSDHVALADAANEVLVSASEADIALSHKDPKHGRGRGVVKTNAERMYHVLWNAGIAEMRGWTEVNASISAAASKIAEIFERPFGGTCFIVEALRSCSQHIPHANQPAQLFAKGPIELPDLSRSGVVRYLPPSAGQSANDGRLIYYAIDDVMRTIPDFEEYKSQTNNQSCTWDDYKAALKQQCSKAYDRVFPDDDALRAAQPALKNRRANKSYASNNLQISGLQWLAITSENGFVEHEDDGGDETNW